MKYNSQSDCISCCSSGGTDIKAGIGRVAWVRTLEKTTDGGRVTKSSNRLCSCPGWWVLNF